MDEIFNSKVKYQEHEDKLYHEITQPTEDLILHRNAQLRNNPGVLKDLGHNQEGGSWGRQVASIPFVMFEQALRDGYELNAPGEHGQKEMNRFLQSENGKKCLVQ